MPSCRRQPGAIEMKASATSTTDPILLIVPPGAGPRHQVTRCVGFYPTCEDQLAAEQVAHHETAGERLLDEADGSTRNTNRAWTRLAPQWLRPPRKIPCRRPRRRVIHRLICRIQRCESEGSQDQEHPREEPRASGLRFGQCGRSHLTQFSPEFSTSNRNRSQLLCPGRSRTRLGNHSLPNLRYSKLVVSIWIAWQSQSVLLQPDRGFSEVMRGAAQASHYFQRPDRAVHRSFGFDRCRYARPQ